MTTAPIPAALRRIREVLEAEQAGRMPDDELLERFVRRREDAAFAALVRRHGPLVFAVCRRVLHNRHDAEDAFQAAFLALARHAGAIRNRASVGSWLHGVAFRLALKARARAVRREQNERRAPQRATADPFAEVSGRDLLGALDEALHALPDPLREPLVLCYLQGRTRDEAARACGCSLGTLKRRLEQGRELLRERLGRRGLALPAALLTAGMAGATVPAALAAAAVRAATSASSAVPAAVAELTCGLLPNTLTARLRTALVLLLGTALIGLGAVPFATPKERGAPPPAAKEPSPPAERPAPAEKPAPAHPAADGKEMTVTGRVLGPDGKPVGGAEVAVLASQVAYQSTWESAALQRDAVIGRTKADADGKFRLTVSPPPGPPAPTLPLLAGAPGLGLGWAWLDPKVASAEAELRLPAEQVVRGRLVDLQGEPVAGARVVLTAVTHHPAQGEKNLWRWRPPAGGLPFGPVPAVVDARGDFAVRGLGPNVAADFEVRDDRVQLHGFTVQTADKKAAENVKLALPPGRTVEGRVTYADTGKPVAGAAVMLVTAGSGEVWGTTDKGGRYRLNARPLGPQVTFSGDELGVHVYPPAGEPYWMAVRGVGWPKGATHREADVTLPRGVLLRGKVTEAGSGKPVAGAYIEYNGMWSYRVRSAADGSYAFAVPAGATGPLTVNAPTPDYVPQVIGSAEILEGKPGGDRIYYHAVVPLGLKRGDKEKELPITLRRGVTVKGRVVGADGKPVKGAVVFAGEYKSPHEKFLSSVWAPDGKFELPGCDPDKTYHLVFAEHTWLTPTLTAEAEGTYGQPMHAELLGPQIKFGATAAVSAKKAAAEPVEVRLAACGSAKLRFVDGAGKPLAKYKPWLQLVVTDGPPATRAIKDGKLSAEVVTLISQYPAASEPATDADGAVNLEGLVPGATYRVKRADLEGEVIKDFTVESGKALEVTVTVK